MQHYLPSSPAWVQAVVNEPGSQKQQPKEPRVRGRGLPVCLRITLSLACLLLGAFGFLRMRSQAGQEKDATLVPPKPLAVPRVIGFEKSRTITRGKVRSVHSACAVETPDGGLRAYWFGGRREGARNVSIWTALWDGQSWGEPEVAIDRRVQENLSSLNIRKLGNPVVHRARDGAVELYFVGVSMGGWSGSAVYHARSPDGGRTFGRPRRLLVSPFANVSTLVKAPPLDDTAGGVLLPVYHEFTDKFPQLVRLDKDRRVVGLVSLRAEKELLQPWVVHEGEGRLRMFTRRAKHRRLKRIFTATSPDGGRTWGKAVPMDQLNPNASVAALSLGRGTLLVCNDHKSERESLRVYIQQKSGEAWRLIHEVDGAEHEADERGFDELEYSYPWVMQTRDGMLHIFYTWNRKQIRHFRFDARDWKGGGE